MKKLLLFLTLLFTGITLHAQETITYLSKNNEPCEKNEAFYFLKKFFSKGDWHLNKFIISSGILISEETLYDSIGSRPKGNNFFYSDSGKLTHKLVYTYYGSDSIIFYYPNGKINGYAKFSSKSKVKKQEGWDENGKFIPKYIAFRQADFEGGIGEFQYSILKILGSNFPKRNGAPIGKYNIKLSFLINTKGELEEVTNDNEVGYGIAKEVISVVKKTGKWNPLIWNNQLLPSRKNIEITFSVNK